MLRPFARWAGGKSWAGDELVSFVRSLDGGKPVVYCEPFLGGGGFLARMLSEGLVLKGHCYLGDLAPEAFLAWKGVLRNPVATAMAAQRWFDRSRAWEHGPEKGYYMLRQEWNERAPRDVSMEGRDLCSVAGLLIAINRLSFKGLLRVNPHGDFNTPYGHLPNPSVDREAIIAFGQTMQAVGAMLVPGGWGQVFEACQDRVGLDAVDPPYAGTTHVAYTVRGWTALDRLQLSLACRSRHMRGWSTFATDARLPDSWDAWAWGRPRPYDRSGGMGDGQGRGRDERGEIIIRAQGTTRGPASAASPSSTS